MSKVLDDFHELKARIKEREEKRAAEDADALAKLDLIRNRVMTGESTGNRIGDFLLSHFGLLEPALVSFYRELEQKIRDHAGELILVVKHRREPVFHGDPMNLDLTTDRLKYLLGILEGGGLVFAGMERTFHPCDAPTGRVAMFSVDEKQIQLTEENLMLPIAYDSSNGYKCVFHDINGSCELFIGTAEVQDYFASLINFHIKPQVQFYRMAKALRWGDADKLPGRALLVEQLSEKLTTAQQAYIQALSSGNGEKTDRVGRTRVDFDQAVLESDQYSVPTKEAVDLVRRTEALYSKK